MTSHCYAALVKDLLNMLIVSWAAQNNMASRVLHMTVTDKSDYLTKMKFPKISLVNENDNTARIDGSI